MGSVKLALSTLVRSARRRRHSTKAAGLVSWGLRERPTRVIIWSGYANALIYGHRRTEPLTADEHAASDTCNHFAINLLGET